MNDSVIATQSTKGNFHLEEGETNLKLYVPRETRDQELCFLTQIPKRLASVFHNSDMAVEKILGDILHSSLVILDDLLDTNGIVQVPGVNQLQPMDPTSAPLQAGTHASELEFGDARSTDTGDDSITETAASESVSDDERTIDTTSASLGSTWDSETIVEPSTVYNSARFSIRNAESAPESGAQRSGYSDLLDQVINAANQTDLPREMSQSLSRAPDRTSPASRLSSEDIFGIRVANPLVHDIKVGAAGELFVSVVANKTFYGGTLANIWSRCTSYFFDKVCLILGLIIGKAQFDITFAFMTNTRI